MPALYKGQTNITDESREQLFKTIELLNTFLAGKKFLIGSEHATLADLSVFSSIANVVVSEPIPFNFSKCGKIDRNTFFKLPVKFQGTGSQFEQLSKCNRLV